mmetsp:Transcript_54602/g.127688  ORF Transcript_54602/g.127688 Transcript_54602/m.127688 type:complete len:90 (-) Transcript_54602:46-315(-)
MLPPCGRMRTADNGVNGVLALLPPGYIGVEADVMDLTEACPSEGNLPLTIGCGITTLQGSGGMSNSKDAVSPRSLWQQPCIRSGICWHH